MSTYSWIIGRKVPIMNGRRRVVAEQTSSFVNIMGGTWIARVSVYISIARSSGSWITTVAVLLGAPKRDHDDEDGVGSVEGN